MGVSVFTIQTEWKLLEAVRLDLEKAGKRIGLILDTFRHEPILADEQDREDLRRVRRMAEGLEAVIERMMEERVELMQEKVRAMCGEEAKGDDGA